MCPPDVGDIGRMMAEVRRFPCALLYQTIHEIEDSFDIEGMLEAGRAHAQVSYALQSSLHLAAPFLHLTRGGCGLCDECTKPSGIPCRHPDKALPSLESYGVDVYNTTRTTHLKYINGQNTVTYFGLLLFSEESYA